MDTLIINDRLLHVAYITYYDIIPREYKRTINFLVSSGDCSLLPLEEQLLACPTLQKRKVELTAAREWTFKFGMKKFCHNRL